MSRRSPSPDTSCNASRPQPRSIRLKSRCRFAPPPSESMASSEPLSPKLRANDPNTRRRCRPPIDNNKERSRQDRYRHNRLRRCCRRPDRTVPRSSPTDTSCNMSRPQPRSKRWKSRCRFAPPPSESMASSEPLSPKLRANDPNTRRRCRPPIDNNKERSRQDRYRHNRLRRCCRRPDRTAPRSSPTDTSCNMSRPQPRSN